MKKIIYIILICLPFISMAQSTDCGTEFSVDYSHKLAKGFSFDVEAEARFKEYSTHYSKGAISAGLQYSLFREHLKSIGMKIKIGANYSLIHRYNNLDVYEFQHRASANITISEQIGMFEISLRERYQCDWRDIERGDYSYNPRMHLRTRLKLLYQPIQIPWEFFVSEEIYYRANHPNNNEFEELRTMLGFTRIINSTNAITLYLKASNEINKKRPDNFYALGISYSFR